MDGEEARRNWKRKVPQQQASANDFRRETSPRKASYAKKKLGPGKSTEKSGLSRRATSVGQRMRIRPGIEAGGGPRAEGGGRPF